MKWSDVSNSKQEGRMEFRIIRNFSEAVISK